MKPEMLFTSDLLKYFRHPVAGGWMYVYVIYLSKGEPVAIQSRYVPDVEEE